MRSHCTGTMKRVRKVAVHRPVTKVDAMEPQVREYSGMPRAMGRKARDVVRVVNRMGRRRIWVPFKMASRRDIPERYSLLMNSISTKESLTTTPHHTHHGNEVVDGQNGTGDK